MDTCALKSSTKDLTLKMVFEIGRQCQVERDFSLLAGHFLDIGLYRLDIGIQFWTRLLLHSDINTGPCSVRSRIHNDIS